MNNGAPATGPAKPPATATPTATAATAQAAGSTVQIVVDGRPMSVPAGQTLLQALRGRGLRIPTLCHVEGLPPTGACRLCVVEVEGMRSLATACSTPVQDGMVVRTHSEAVRLARRGVLELLLANHPQDCLGCSRALDCELRELAAEYGARPGTYEGARRHAKVDTTSEAIVRDPEKCILCGRCVQICRHVQGVGAIDFVRRGFETQVNSAFEAGLGNSNCVLCGQCVRACPTGALVEVDATEQVWEALADPDLRVIVQVAPAVRVSLGEAFGLSGDDGATTTGRLVAALRRLGFWKVFDTQFAADLTVVEEAAELVERLGAMGHNGAHPDGSQPGASEGPRQLAGSHPAGPLPLMTSCCPAWVRFLELHYPERLAHLSSCRSPQQMFGAVAKAYYSRIAGVHPEQLFVVSVMPCVAKKAEALRPELSAAPGTPADGMHQVDAVLTTRELIRMLQAAGIDLAHLEPEPFDPALGASTGAATIFGTTGGVAEAALRTGYWMATGEELPDDGLEFGPLQGMEGVREFEVPVGGVRLRCAVAHGLANARKLLESEDFENYHFIEVMACPGGCVGGGGQPRSTNPERVRARAEGLRSLDRTAPVRRSHQNPEVKALYEEFLGKPGSATAHALLHTTYVERQVPVPGSGCGGHQGGEAQ